MGFLPDAEAIISASFDERKSWKKVVVESGSRDSPVCDLEGEGTVLESSW